MESAIIFIVASLALVNCETVHFLENNLDEGSYCTTASGYKGVCERSRSCPNHLRTNSVRDICSFQHGVKIVCCVNKWGSQNPGKIDKTGIDYLNEISDTDKYKKTFKDIEILEVHKSKRISEQKFEEYMKRIYAGYANDINSLNGRELSSPGQYPHMSAIGITITDHNIDWKCGGSLISENFVLTAAHCTDFNGQSPDVVRIGDLNLREMESTVDPQTFGIQRIVVYPRYRKSSYYHDIALVKLSGYAVFTRYVRPACLWSKLEIPHDNVVAMGYGSTTFGRAKTNKLTELTLTLLSNQICNYQLPYTPKARQGIIESQMCAIDLHGNRDTCQGDSGGPLQLNIHKNERMDYFLVGITSYGVNCGSQYPSVYTRIYAYLDWVENIVWK